MTQAQANRVMTCARRATATWNRNRPDESVSWEVVEEAMLASILAKHCFHPYQISRAAADQHARYLHFRGRMPAVLAEMLFDEIAFD